MGKKVTIIGAGSVGSTIAYTMAVNGIATEIVMIDINEAKAMGEALDIRQGVPFCPPVSIYAGSYPEAENSDIVILTSGVARKPGQSRLELAQTNVNITKAIIPQIVKYAPNAIYIIVSNPVDILTYVFHKVSGLPEKPHHRLRHHPGYRPSARPHCGILQHQPAERSRLRVWRAWRLLLRAVVHWATISTIPVDQLRRQPDQPRHASSPSWCTPRWRATSASPAARSSSARARPSTRLRFRSATSCKCIFSGADTTMTVSTMMHGEYGIDDVCLSTLAIVGPDGVAGKVAGAADSPMRSRRCSSSSSECLRGGHRPDQAVIAQARKHKYFQRSRGSDRVAGNVTESKQKVRMKHNGIPHRTRLHGRGQGTRRQILGGADRAQPRELPDRRGHRDHAPRDHARLRHPEEGGGHRQPRPASPKR